MLCKEHISLTLPFIGLMACSTTESNMETIEQLSSMGYTSAEAACAVEALREHYSVKEVDLLGKSYEVEQIKLVSEGETFNSLKSSAERLHIAGSFGNRLSSLSLEGEIKSDKMFTLGNTSQLEKALKYSKTFSNKCSQFFEESMLKDAK